MVVVAGQTRNDLLALAVDSADAFDADILDKGVRRDSGDAERAHRARRSGDQGDRGPVAVPDQDGLAHAEFLEHCWQHLGGLVLHEAVCIGLRHWIGSPVPAAVVGHDIERAPLREHLGQVAPLGDAAETLVQHDNGGSCAV